MAEIYLAVAPTVSTGQRFVTLKLIRPDFATDPDYINFFLTEGRVALQCSHPNLPSAFELGEVDGRWFLAMEYIHGTNLLEVLKRAIRERTMLEIRTAVTVGLAIAAGLEHVHNLRDVHGRSLDVIHRDVTPQNVMLSSEGAVKLIDFGIVRSAVQRHQTQAGTVKGKFAYMAPEQLIVGHQFDHRTDLFGLGIVLWETLAARPLMRGRSDYETIERVRSFDIPDPRVKRPDIPKEISRIVLKALARSVDDRYQTASDMLVDLEQAAQICGIVPSVTGIRDQVAQFCGQIPRPKLALPARCASEAAITNVKPRAKTGIAADPLLVYYLRESGARLPTHVAVNEPTPAKAPPTTGS